MRASFTEMAGLLNQDPEPKDDITLFTSGFGKTKYCHAEFISASRFTEEFRYDQNQKNLRYASRR
jgi:hypothetical protein